MRITIFLLLISSASFGQNFPILTGEKPAEWQFVRIDTTKGVVSFLKKGNTISTINEAIKIDSVFSKTEWVNQGQCDMGNGMSCAVGHYSLETLIDKRLVKIETVNGRQIDTKKNYTFIPESQMQ